MAPGFGILIILACAASCQSLSCMTCASITSDSCTGLSSTCPAGNVCGAVYTQTIAGGSTVAAVYAMSCTPQNQCSLGGSMTLSGGVKVKLAAGCCTTDNCTPKLSSSSSASSVPNGLVCRSCLSADSTWCYTSDTMQCTGNENMCLLQTTKLTGSMSSATAFRGCATKSICDLGSQYATVNGLTTDVKFTCTSGSPALRQPFYLPALIGLLLVKFVF